MNNLTLINNGIPTIGSFEAYKHYVRNIPNITEEEEAFLAKKLKEENCLEAAQKLILSQLKTVLHIVYKYNGYGLPPEDLVQEGNIGLMKAVKNFDLKYKVRLYTYSLVWIKSEIQSYILKNWKIVKIASTKNLKKLFFNFKSTQKELLNLGVPQNELVKSLALKLQVTEEQANEMEKYFYAEDVQLEYERELNPSFDILSEHNVALEYESKHDLEHLEKQLLCGFEKLTPNQQTVLKMRFYEDKKKTHKEISQILNISSERVRQIEQEALSKLKKIIHQ